MKWKDWLKALAPIVLPLVNLKLAPLGPAIVHGMEVAEDLHTKGSDKLAHVQELVKTAADAANSVAGKEVIDTNGLSTAVENGVNTVIKAINAVHPKTANE